MTKYLKWVIAILFGSAAGFAYWYFIGCTTGYCAITSSPINSSLYGGLLGILFVNAFTGTKQEKSDRDPK